MVKQQKGVKIVTKICFSTRLLSYSLLYSWLCERIKKEPPFPNSGATLGDIGRRQTRLSISCVAAGGFLVQGDPSGGGNLFLTREDVTIMSRMSNGLYIHLHKSSSSCQ